MSDYPHSIDCNSTWYEVVTYQDGNYVRARFDESRCNCHNAELKRLRAELVSQGKFNDAFADKLKEFGTIDRLIEQYSQSKMECRELRDRLEQAEAALEKCRATCERAKGVDASREESS